jgi:hypothetical protein
MRRCHLLSLCGAAVVSLFSPGAGLSAAETDAAPKEVPQIAAPTRTDLKLEAEPTDSADGKEGTGVVANPVNHIREGIFYLIRPVSVQTDDGVLGLNPGTIVSLQPDGTYRGQGHKLEITPAFLTNDPLIGLQAAAADRATQTEVQEGLKAGAASEREAKMRGVAKKSATPAPRRVPPRAQKPAGSKLGVSGGLQGSKIERSTGLGGKSK